jgi:hypothetical protein
VYNEKSDYPSSDGSICPVKGAFTAAMPDSDVLPRDPAICRIDPCSDRHWDADLAACPGATFFHGSAWARVLCDTYGFKPVYFAVRQPDRILSLLPMMEVDSWLTGRRGVSLPFTDECAPLCAHADLFGRLYQEAFDYATLRQWKYVECRGGIQLFANAAPSVSFLGHRLDLRGGEDALLNGCEGSVRRAVRKAERSGLTLEFSTDLNSVRIFHGLLCKTRRRHGVPPQPFSLFASIHRRVLAEKQGWVVLARMGRIPVAGAVFFHFGKTAIYKFGASEEAFQHLRANNLVMWEAIKHFANRGFEVLDFGRSSLTNSGLQKFKLSWGTVEHRIDYVRQDCRTGGFAFGSDGATGWHTRILGALPTPVFKLVGRVLYKHMA